MYKWQRSREWRLKPGAVAVPLTAPLRSLMSDETHLQAQFEKFDADGSGYIDESEFAQVVKSLGASLSAEKIAVAFLAIDVNGSGRVRFGEFSAWWKKHHAR